VKKRERESLGFTETTPILALFFRLATKRYMDLGPSFLLIGFDTPRIEASRTAECFLNLHRVATMYAID
jgi:glycosyltransferase A (GT-A) superfamily protein (DUF2064 family)